MKKLFFMSLLLCFIFYKTTYSEEKKFNYDQHKEKLIEKKLLLNSFKKCEEYINETSVELFLNCSDKNKKRLDFIIKLHNEGMTNEMIVEILKSKGIKRRNKNDNYSVKDVFMCITKLKNREERIKDIKYKLGKWKLWREY